MAEKDKVEKYKGDREASFINAEVSEWLAENKNNPKGLCLGRFYADVVVEGLKDMSSGDIIKAEGKEYEITKIGKRCFPECELLAELGAKCPLATGVGFGKRVEICSSNSDIGCILK